MALKVKHRLIQYLFYRKEEEGFTLVELIVVVMIVGTLSAIALPNWERTKLKAEAAGAKTVITNIKKECESNRDLLMDEIFTPMSPWGYSVQPEASVSCYGDPATGLVSTVPNQVDKNPTYTYEHITGKITQEGGVGSASQKIKFESGALICKGNKKCDLFGTKLRSDKVVIYFDNYWELSASAKNGATPLQNIKLKLIELIEGLPDGVTLQIHNSSNGDGPYGQLDSSFDGLTKLDSQTRMDVKEWIESIPPYSRETGKSSMYKPNYVESMAGYFADQDSEVGQIIALSSNIHGGVYRTCGSSTTHINSCVKSKNDQREKNGKGTITVDTIHFSPEANGCTGKEVYGGYSWMGDIANTTGGACKHIKIGQPNQNHYWQTYQCNEPYCKKFF